MTAHTIHRCTDSRKSRVYIIKTFRDRDEWIKLMLAVDSDTLSPTHKIVAARIAFHYNIETGRCDPSLPTLANGTGMSERNVRRMINEIEDAGWLIAEKSRGGRRHGDEYNTSSFVLSTPVTRTPSSAFNPDTIVRDQKSNPDKSGSLTRTNGVANPDTVVRQEKSESTANKRTAKKDSQPQFDLEEDGRREAKPSAPDTTADDFEVFWKQYPKRADKADALRGYRTVIKKSWRLPSSS